MLDEDQSVARPFVVGDVDTDLSALVVGASSNNVELFPEGSLQVSGSDANRTLTLTPAPNASGSALVSVLVSDGDRSASTQVAVTVNAVNDKPVISAMSPVTFGVDEVSPPVVFTISDQETPSNELTLSVQSTDESLLPVNNVQITGAGAGAGRSMNFAAQPGESGLVTLTVTVSDGQAAASRNLMVYVLATPLNVQVPANSADGNLTIIWSPVANATYYEISEKFNETDWIPRSLPPGVTSKDYAALANGRYYFKVRACNSYGCGNDFVSPALVVDRTPNKRVIFIHTDNLGSPVVETNEFGEEL